MRVLHLHSGNLYGGVETLLVTLSRLRSQAPEMEPEHGLCFEGRLAEELRASGVAVHMMGEVRVSRPWSVLRARRRLRELLARERFDAAVCHAPWAQGVFGPAVREAGVPLVFFLHGPVRGRHWLERWARWTPPGLALCNSRFTAGTLDRLYPGARRHVLYLPVVPYEPLGQGVRAAVRAELGASDEAVVIIQVSRMEAWKGHALHLRALGEMRDESRWVCWMVGGAQREEERRYEAELRALAQELGIAGRVRFLGQRADARELLSAADVYCQPNTDPEPFGLSLVEALGARLPVVSTAMGGALEIVDASCGALVVPEPAAVAGALRRLVADRELRVKLGAAGEARALALCHPVERLRELAAVLRRAG